MCRIAGIIDKKKGNLELESEIQSMCELLEHGGPDDEGFLVEEGLAFGHRRLALIDLSPSGHQPMFYHQGQLAITFNGEIYNYLELRSELISLGFEFSTKSDTEVILAGYQAWGTGSFAKLKGMFAFAIYDRKLGKSFLVRDPSGIKPLYFSTANESLVFASEVRAFKWLKHEENPDWKIYFLAFGHIPEPYTTFLGINMLAKGHYLSWEHQNNFFEILGFESNRANPRIMDQAVATDQVFKTLKASVKRHLLSDAPIGVFLSGGIDSSILTLLADEVQLAENDQKGVNTLSINFDEHEFSEKSYQELIISQIRGSHSDYTISKDLFSSLFPRALAAMDQPTTDGINSWFVNYFAKEKGLKAVLSGIGADELFGGYPSFRRMPKLKYLSLVPSSLLKFGSYFNKSVFKRAYYLSYKNFAGQYLFLRGIFSPPEIAAILNLPISKINLVLKSFHVNMPPHLSDQERASWMETNLYMQNQLLKDTDTMSMQHGIEVRIPFLDADLISLVSSIKDNVLYSGEQPKSLLIESFKKLLPQAIWDRPKMGFTFPFQKWLQDEKCLNHIGTESKKVNQLLSDFKAGKLHWSKAMALYVLFKDRDAA
ncbi:asparagine synthase (glutamine-hydrolyzing) [Pedobacter frigidisoli]|uniref:asparagine synthase (glutamine-hydrolyzing) n=1 Tax=Pedobacter frigidisoli TaxID=2530455 RepID=A0A4V2MLI1_9SPHI|nr:asparagine synthase (glutamine-hydrolyzing) [Pedobacter frigidisoli]TCD02197.1 asparagine synthase (glutamine-hydrolyzing) [Pedobacter frigidisoli]